MYGTFYERLDAVAASLGFAQKSQRPKKDIWSRSSKQEVKEFEMQENFSLSPQSPEYRRSTSMESFDSRESEVTILSKDREGAFWGHRTTYTNQICIRNERN